MEPGKGWQSVIFEPLQDVQMSRSNFQVTSFVDFQLYIGYFDNYEEYLNKFIETIAEIPHSTLYKAFAWDIGGTFNGNDTHVPTCDSPPWCNLPSNIRQFAYDHNGFTKVLNEYPAAMCQNRHAQACMLQWQLARLQNTTEQLRKSYQCVKYRFFGYTWFCERSYGGGYTGLTVMISDSLLH